MTETTDTNDAPESPDPAAVPGPEADGLAELPDAPQADEPGGETHRPSARLSFGVAFALGLVAALLLGVGALYAYDRQFTGRILPGVHVGSVDLSGLTADEARAALQQGYGSLSDGR